MTPAVPSLAMVETAAICLAATLVVAHVLPRVLYRSTGRFHGNIRTLLRLLASGLAWAAGLSATLSVLGVPVIAAFGVGVVGAGLAVATAQLAQGLIGGAWLLLEGDFDIGDHIDVGMYLDAEIITLRLRSIVLGWRDPTTQAQKRITVPYQQLMGGAFAVSVPSGHAPVPETYDLPVQPESIRRGVEGLLAYLRRRR